MIEDKIATLGMIVSLVCGIMIGYILFANDKEKKDE